MNYILENEAWRVQLKESGAELCSVRKKSKQREYIWQADPQVWARHAPVLFPVVGRLRNDAYQAGGDTYSMKQHGFARDRDFSTLEQEHSRITFGLTADDSSMQHYPYRFVLDIIYTLQDNELQVTYKVSNKDQRDMPFSIGGHPAFAAPRIVDQEVQEYLLLFEQSETLERQYVKQGLRSGESRMLMENERKLALHPKLFEEDAIIFEKPQSSKVSLVVQSTGSKLVEVEFGDFPYLGIWQKPGADFICIEPWHGLADRADFQGDIFEKEGIIRLGPEKSFERSYCMRFF
jgi:galactose mutarotase-like enzyme